MNFKLALDIPDNSYYPLSEEFLDIITEQDSLESLESIEQFLIKHTTEEIFESIKRSNVVLPKPIEETKLIIVFMQNDKVRKMEAHPKDNAEYHSFSLTNFIFHSIEDKEIKNQLKNYFDKTYMPQDLKDFTKAYAGESLIIAIDKFRVLDYYSRRLLKDYAIEIAKKKEETRRLRITEK